MDAKLHAPGPWRVGQVRDGAPLRLLDANDRPVDLADHGNQMFVALLTRDYYKRVNSEPAGKRAEPTCNFELFDNSRDALAAANIDCPGLTTAMLCDWLYAAPEPATEKNLPPMIRQYLAVKRELPEDTLLLFRVGDFYELFMGDARRAAPICGLALTHRAGQPMCGIPYYCIDSYLAKIVRAGLSAAICDQMEDPRAKRPDGQLVRREVTRIVTPGTEAAARRERAEAELARAERFGYDTETCLANAAECGGL